MGVLAQDTSPDAERVLIQLWRDMTPSRKLELVGEMYATSKRLVRLGLRQRFPAASDEEIERRLQSLLLGEELATKVYGRSSYEAGIEDSILAKLEWYRMGGRGL